MVTDIAMINKLQQLREVATALRDMYIEADKELNKIIIELETPEVSYTLHTDTYFKCSESLSEMLIRMKYALAELCEKPIVIKQLRFDGAEGYLVIKFMKNRKHDEVAINVKRLTVVGFLVLWDIEEKTGLITRLIGSIISEVNWAREYVEKLRKNYEELRKNLEKRPKVEVGGEE